MGSPKSGASNPIIGAYRCSRKRVDKTEEHKTEEHKTEEHKTEGHKTEGHKTEEHKTEEHKTEEHKTEEHKTMLGFKIALNRKLITKLIKKNSLPSTAHESQFSDKQKFHSAPEQRRTFNIEDLSN